MISLGAISADLPQMQPQSSKMPQINLKNIIKHFLIYHFALTCLNERSSLLGSKLSNNPYMNYSILYKPSLSELMDELELWWKEIDPLQRFEADIEKVLLLLVKKGISQDLDGSLKIIQKYLGKQIGKTSQKTLTLEDFKRLFCRCFFKDSLIQLSQDIEKIKSLDQSAPLSLKLGLYQRQLMMDGIEKEGIENQHGRHIMNALSLIKTQQEENEEGGDSYIRHDKYEDFVQDPFGKLAKELKERELRKNRQDDYIKSIKLARISQSTSTTIQNALKGKFGKISGDLDKIIVQNQEVEEVIGDRNNMENFLFKVQKQKQQDIIQQENKMRKIHNANEVNHNQRQRNHNKVNHSPQDSREDSSSNHQIRKINLFNMHKFSVDSSTAQSIQNNNNVLNFSTTIIPNLTNMNQSSQQLSNFNSKKLSTTELSQNPITQQNQTSLIQQQYSDHKAKIFHENFAIDQLQNPHQISLATHYLEGRGAQRIEGIKLPNIYKEKGYLQRVDEGQELLNQFQKLINTSNQISTLIQND